MGIKYEKLNEELNKIYSQKFYSIEGTPYEYHYLEEEHYALRRRGKLNFVIARAKNPLQAVTRLINMVEVEGMRDYEI